MELLVCIKQVPDTSEIKLDPETNNLIRTGLPSIVNPYDMHALEAALGAPADRPATDAVSGELDSLHLSRESPRGDADAQPSEK